MLKNFAGRLANYSTRGTNTHACQSFLAGDLKTHTVAQVKSVAEVNGIFP